MDATESTLQGQLKAWRRHQFPETGFEEVNTSDRRAHPDDARADVHRGIGGSSRT